MVMFYSNKIGHECNSTAKDMLREFCTEKNIKYKQRLDPLGNAKLFSKLFKSLHIYFNSDQELDVDEIKNQKDILKKYGIEEKELKELEKNGYKVLANVYRDSMFIKSEMIKELIPMLKANEEFSYSFGLAKEITKDQYGTRQEKDVFVIDIPYYSQIAVHLKSQDLISALSDKKYLYPIYSKQNVLIIDELSPFQQEFVKKHRNNLVGSLKTMKDERQAHEIAVKSGLDKHDIDKIHEGR